MAKESGTNVLLQVNEGIGSPTAFVTVAGQQNTTFNGSTETDDITDKSHSGWGSTLNVLVRGTVNCDGKADWPDTNGLDQVRQAWENRTNIEAKVILNSAGANYTGVFTVSSFEVSGPFNGATSYSFTLENAEALNYAAS